MNKQIASVFAGATAIVALSFARPRTIALGPRTATMVDCASARSWSAGAVDGPCSLSLVGAAPASCTLRDVDQAVTRIDTIRGRLVVPMSGHFTFSCP